MHVNELSKEILDTYKAAGEWPGESERLMARIYCLHRLAVEAQMDWEGSGKIIDWGGFCREDCAVAHCCDVSKEKCIECKPQGLAFRLADIVMHTLAMMAELGIDADAVIMAEHNYDRKKVQG